MLRIGTAGWSYPDWEGIVYPEGASTRREALPMVAALFDTVEINVTFYRPPTARMSESWVRRVASRPRFRFTAKLWQGFTHQRDQRHLAEEKSFKEGIAPLGDAGRLGALLAQFPQSFRNTAQNQGYLEELIARFSCFPLVIEVRHASWVNDSFLASLDERRVGFCNVDQPLIGDAAPPTSVMTGGIGYVRLHGRNRENWFRKDAGRDARYDYLYSREEIHEWAERIRLMQGKVKGGGEIFIIANNHYRGQGPANALELIHLMTGQPVTVPETLAAAYPRLASIALRSEKPGMLPL
ncbi:MAG TPA: DUF72 domain-containing protein [Candidatus Polarisedimenticolia bacterium]|jgi:uncharacterized protein YecE (DUF72 family)